MHARILLLLWRSWHLRNDVIHQKGKESIASSIAFLQAYHGDSTEQVPCHVDSKGKRSLAPTSSTRPEVDVAPPSWTAPPVGWIKLNTDGSMLPNSKISGAGAVARDSTGAVIFAACTPLPNCTDVEEAEARAALLGLTILSRHGPSRVILEMDNVAAVTALRAKTQNRSRVWAVYQEAKALLLDMHDCVIIHTKRETNRVADSLAKLAKSLGERDMRDDLPIPVRELVIHDSNSCNTV
jgi:ribonuclease HI